MDSKKTFFFNTTDGIHCSSLDEDHAFIDFNGQKMILTYDALYDLAIRFAFLVEKMGSSEGDQKNTDFHLH